jgi:acetyl-CoA C-acetyltransferase
MGKDFQKIAMIGVGTTNFGDLYDASISDLAVSSLFSAIKSSGAKKSDIEALFIGNMGSEVFLHQEHLGNLITSQANMNVPNYKVENAGASGATALRLASHSILSGVNDIVGVIGVEKMTEIVKQSEAQTALSTGIDFMWEANMGGTLASGFALMTKAHMRKFGTTREQIAQVAVKNHFNASKNPNAQFRNQIKIENVLKSKVVADPLRLFDATAACDGSASVILASPEVAESYDSEPVFIYTSKQGNAPMALHNRENLYELSAVKFAANAAYNQLGITNKDINFAEVHDMFTISEILAIEALGLVEQGKGGEATESGQTSLTGEIPINTSGGLKGRGAPLGAVGVAQAIEVYEQFKGKAGERQIKDIIYALSQSMGGTGGSSIVTVYGR